MLSVYDNLLDRYMPPSLLVNERRQLLESFGGAEKLLRIKGRRLSADLMDLLETEARTTIAGALNRVIRHGQPLTFSGVWLNDGENEQQYRLAIEPVDGATNGSGNYLILFEPTSPARATPTNDRQEFNADEMSRDQVTHLEDELRYTKENLQATVEELETSNEEMQATNEELVASNEELQSTNEELHSVNEELYTVNGEHQKKITELAELNQDMVHLLDSTDVAIVYLDENLCIRKFTPKVAEIFDLVDQDVGRRIGTFSHRIRHDDLLERLQGVLDTGERYEAEVRDHDDKCFLLRILPYRVSDRIAGVVLSLIDINVLHDARSRISRLSSIVESSSSAIIGTNVDGVIESWNPAAGRLYEYSEEEAIGKNISMLVPDSHKEESARSIETIRREDEHVVIPETERITKSGKRITISLSRSSIKDQDGNIIGVSSISRDIARLKQVERAKADTEARLRLLLDSTAEAIYGVDRNGLCTFVNPACTRLLGYTSEELLGQKLHELIHHKQVDGSPLSPEERTTFQVFSDGMPVHRPEDVFWRKDGSYFYAEVWSHPMYEDDNLVGAVVTFLDVTHRKEAVENLRNEARRREQFLAMLSHELRNPLSAIRTATRLQNASEIDEATVAESRKVIDRQTRQMTRLLDDLLDVSRITEDKIGLNIEPVDLRSTVESALQSVQPLADDCQIGIKTELPDNPVIVLADATRIEQIQSNLLSNAIKYSYPGATVRLSLEVAGDEALLQVTDGGAGIAPQMLDQIFDMFVQVEDTIDRAHGGMGVGLTLVKRLVEMHDGTITAHSEGIDKGSEFIVRLPLSNDRSVTVKELCESASNGATVESALVIEDQDDNRKMLTSLLRLEGITVHAAASGVEGLALARSKQPDVAIVDIGLPEMNGYEVAEAIRAELGDEMFLIALTGYGQPRDIKNAKNAGFDHHLVKPLEPDLLVSALQRGRTSADV